MVPCALWWVCMDLTVAMRGSKTVLVGTRSHGLQEQGLL